MKKILLLVAILATVATTNISAESEGSVKSINTFSAGDVAINLVGDIGSLEHNFMGGFSGVIEVGILDGMIHDRASIGVGLQAGWGSSGNSVKSGDVKEKWHYTRTRIATRGVFHYQFIPQLDTYAGLTLGIVDINHGKYKYKVNGDVTDKTKWNDADFAYGLFVGVRYMVAKNFGFTSELSLERFAIFNLGVCLKF